MMGLFGIIFMYIVEKEKQSLVLIRVTLTTKADNMRYFLTILTLLIIIKGVKFIMDHRFNSR